MNDFSNQNDNNQESGYYRNPYDNGQYEPQNGTYQQGGSGSSYGGYQQGYNGPNYGGYQQGYDGPNYGGYQPYGEYGQPVYGKVSNTFLYIFMGLLFVSFIVDFLMVREIIGQIDFSQLLQANFMDRTSSYFSLFETVTLSDFYYNLSNISSFLGFGLLAMGIADIVNINRQGYKVIGLVIFMIFFKPGYFLWRAHVVHEGKGVAILATLAMVVGIIVYLGWFTHYVIGFTGVI